MVAIITGDIIRSRKVTPTIWLPVLERALHKYTTKSNQSEIFRGDSFQIIVPIDTVFETVFYLKSAIKSIPKLDVRMGIGVGTIDYHDEKVTKSNGTAFVNSGSAFEKLKKETLYFQSNSPEIDATINLILELSSHITTSWNENMAKTVNTALENPESSQKELATLLNKKYQSQISNELRKSGYNSILKTIVYCTKIIQQL